VFYARCIPAAATGTSGYSAVLALLRILEEKGHIRHRRDGARYVYVPRGKVQVSGQVAVMAINALLAKIIK